MMRALHFSINSGPASASLLPPKMLCGYCVVILIVIATPILQFDFSRPVVAFRDALL